MHYKKLNFKIIKFYIDVLNITEERFINEYASIGKINNLKSAKNIYRLQSKQVSERTAYILHRLFIKHTRNVNTLTGVDFDLHQYITKIPGYIGYEDTVKKIYKEIDKYYFNKLSLLDKLKQTFAPWFK